MQSSVRRVVQGFQLLSIAILLAMIVDLFLLRYVYLNSPHPHNISYTYYSSIFWILKISSGPGNFIYKGMIIAKPLTFAFIMILPMYLGVTNALVSTNPIKTRRHSLSLLLNLLAILLYVFYTGFEMLYIDYTAIQGSNLIGLVILVIVLFIYMLFQISIYYLSQPDGKSMTKTSDSRDSSDLYPTSSGRSEQRFFTQNKVTGLWFQWFVNLFLMVLSLLIGFFVLPFSPLSNGDHLFIP